MSLTLLRCCTCSEEDKSEDNEDPDISKIKKVQSFFRGWLCRLNIKTEIYQKRLLCVFRRRWKQIVENYIRSPHAESMRKRNWWVVMKQKPCSDYLITRLIYPKRNGARKCPVFRCRQHSISQANVFTYCLSLISYLSLEF